eukprot:scaffold325822_cov57-Tisochrysis_lutea.AAC.4
MATERSAAFVKKACGRCRGRWTAARRWSESAGGRRRTSRCAGVSFLARASERFALHFFHESKTALSPRRATYSRTNKGGATEMRRCARGCVDSSMKVPRCRSLLVQRRQRTVLLATTAATTGSSSVLKDASEAYAEAAASSSPSIWST